MAWSWIAASPPDGFDGIIGIAAASAAVPLQPRSGLAWPVKVSAKNLLETSGT